MKVKFVYTKLIEEEKEIDDKFFALLDEENSWAYHNLKKELCEQSWETWAKIEKDKDFYRPMYILSENDDYLIEY